MAKVIYKKYNVLSAKKSKIHKRLFRKKSPKNFHKIHFTTFIAAPIGSSIKWGSNVHLRMKGKEGKSANIQKHETYHWFYKESTRYLSKKYKNCSNRTQEYCVVVFLKTKRKYTSTIPQTSSLIESILWFWRYSRKA